MPPVTMCVCSCCENLLRQQTSSQRSNPCSLESISILLRIVLYFTLLCGRHVTRWVVVGAAQTKQCQTCCCSSTEPEFNLMCLESFQYVQRCVSCVLQKIYDGKKNVVPEVWEVLDKIKDFSEKVQSSVYFCSGFVTLMLLAVFNASVANFLHHSLRWSSFMRFNNIHILKYQEQDQGLSEKVQYFVYFCTCGPTLMLLMVFSALVLSCMSTTFTF